MTEEKHIRQAEAYRKFSRKAFLQGVVAWEQQIPRHSKMKPYVS